MTKKLFSIVSVFVVAMLLLSACSFHVTPTNDGGLSVDLNPTAVVPVATGAPTAAITASPSAAVPTATLPAVNPTATQPTAVLTATTCPAGVNCPVATFLGASSTNSIDFKAGTTYHVNVSVTGATAGIETNMMFTALKDFTMVFDGSAWSYTAPITDGTCQLCAETKGDNWVENAPKLQGLVEYHTPPCSGQPTVAWNDSILIKTVTLPSASALPTTAAAITNGVIVQGGDGTTTITGICPTGAYCGVTYWIPGETGIQHKIVILAGANVTVAGFRGTLSSWDHKPTATEFGIDAKNSQAALADAEASGITFTGDFKEVTIK